MPDTFNIPENVVAAAEDAYRERLATQTVEERRVAMPAAIQACLKEWGAREETMGGRPSGVIFLPARHRRLVFPWEPVEGESCES